MAGGKFLSPTVDALTKSMSFLEERHRVIANNIANANTPFFKAKHVPLAEFQQALAKALAKAKTDGSKPLTLAPTEHIRDTRYGLKVEATESRGADAGTLRHDGNNVNLEAEMADLGENTVMYRVMSELLARQFRGMKAALAERVDG